MPDRCVVSDRATAANRVGLGISGLIFLKLSEDFDFKIHTAHIFDVSDLTNYIFHLSYFKRRIHLIKITLITKNSRPMLIDVIV